MTTDVAPIYIGALNGAPLRFYAPQTADDMMPWVATEDLANALRMNRNARRALLKADKAHPDLAKRIRTSDGAHVAVLAYRGVQGLMGALKDVGLANDAEHMAFTKQLFEAAKRSAPMLFDVGANGETIIRSSAMAMLVGATHDEIVDKILEEGIDAKEAPPAN
jgi:hypothetical protein